MAEEGKKDKAKTTTSAGSSTGTTLGGKKTETKMKIPKKGHPKEHDAADDADEDYVTFLNSMNWRDYEWFLF